MQLVRTEQEISTFRSENAKLKEMLKFQKNRTEILEKTVESRDCKIADLELQLRDRKTLTEELQTQNNQKQCTIRELKMEQEHLKRKYQSKIVAEKEKTRGQLAREFKEKEEAWNVSTHACIQF